MTAHVSVNGKSLFVADVASSSTVYFYGRETIVRVHQRKHKVTARALTFHKKARVRVSFTRYR